MADVLARFTPWRLSIAQMRGRAEHHRGLSADECAEMLGHCASIERGIVEARTDLLLSLGDAPPKVAGHSHVVDVERALDNLEEGVSDVRRKLELRHRG